MAKKVKKSDFIATGQVAANRRASFDYALEETFIAGIELMGTEVKSLRLGKASLTDTYGSFSNGELFIENLKIEPYSNRGYEKHDPLRKKKLLLTRHEIDKIIGAMAKKGYSLIAKKLFFDEHGRAKLEIALGRGKKLYDKREAVKERDIKRSLRGL
ncbi:MAG: SsrA-binding protein SmpB [Alphaproteobacteria bacterium]|nr:SsrA-binding protein SmpB [Alphaproteobacteria bacterium]